MGTYHYIDGSRIRVFYRGNTKTCGRCHQGSGQCKGGGVAKECEELGGSRVYLSDHMKSLWSKVNFNPTSFKLPEDTDDIEGGGDKPISEERIPKVTKPPMSETDKAKLIGVRINNFDLENSEDEILEFLQKNISKNIEKENIEMMKNTRNISVSVISGLTSENILAALSVIDFKESKKLYLGRPLYCKPIRNITPVKPTNPAGTPPDLGARLKTQEPKPPPKVPEKKDSKKEKKGKQNKTPAKTTLHNFFTPDPVKSEFAKLLEERSRSIQRTPGSSGRCNASVSPTPKKD